MEQADDEPLRHSQSGKLMERDIVQFVPFNDFKNQHMSAIAKETLEEVPGQVTSFMAMHGISPNPPRHAKQATMDNIYGALANDDSLNPNDIGNNPYIQQEEKKQEEVAQAQPANAFAYGGGGGGGHQYSEGNITAQPGGGGAAAAPAPPAYSNANANVPANPYYGGSAQNGNY